MMASTNQQNQANIDVVQGIYGLWRRPLVVLAPIILGLLGLALFLKYYPHSFTSSTVLVFDPRENMIISSKSVLSPLTDRFSTVASEVQIMQSAHVLEKVAQRLQLQHNKAFLAGAPQSVFKKRLKGALMSGLEFVDLDNLAEAYLKRSITEDKKATDRQLIAYAAERIADGLDVEADQTSLIVTISYTGTDPDLAATIANEVANSYLNNQLDSRFEAAKRANVWLNERLVKLREDVKAADSRVSEYKSAYGLINTEGAAPYAEQLRELHTELRQAATATVKALDNYERAKEARAGKVVIAEQVAKGGTTLLSKLRDQLAVSRTKHAELRSKFGNNHPEVRKVNAETRGLVEQLNAEGARVVIQLKDVYQAAIANEIRLDRKIDALKAMSKAAEKAMVKLRELEREALSVRALYDAFLSRFRESAEYKQLRSTDFRVVSEAVKPEEPSGTKTLVLALLVVFGSASVGVSGAFCLEVFDTRIKSAEQIENLAGLPVISVLPKVQKKLVGTQRTGGFDRSAATYRTLRNLNIYDEGISQLRTALAFEGDTEPAQIVLLASALGGVGKSSISFALASHAPKAGLRTVLINSDTRHPMDVSFTGHTPKNDVFNVLQKIAGKKKMTKADLAGITVKYDDVGLDIIPLDSPDHESVFNVCAHETMKTFLGDLRKHYDLIVLDGPPVLPVADAVVWSNLADRVVLVAEWNETTIKDLKRTSKKLERMNASIGGAVLNKMPSRYLIDYYGQV